MILEIIIEDSMIIPGCMFLATVFSSIFFLNNGFLVNHTYNRVQYIEHSLFRERAIFIGILNEFATVWKIGKVFAM